MGILTATRALQTRVSDRHAVARELGVRGDKRQPLNDRLSDEQAIEWIAVQQRELSHVTGMRNVDREREKAAELQFSIDIRVWRQGQFADGDLNSDLPRRRGTDPHFRRMLNEVTGTCAESRVVVLKPEPCVRIEQEPPRREGGDGCPHGSGCSRSTSA